MYDQDKIDTGDTVIAGGWINPLLEYSEQIKRATEPMPIDVDWKPGFMEPDYRNTKVFLHIGDRLIVLSDKAYTSEGCPWYIYYVQDKDGNKFYLSAHFFYKEPAQLSLPFSESARLHPTQTEET